MQKRLSGYSSEKLNDESVLLKWKMFWAITWKVFDNVINTSWKKKSTQFYKQLWSLLYHIMLFITATAQPQLQLKMWCFRHYLCQTFLKNKPYALVIQCYGSEDAEMGLARIHPLEARKVVSGFFMERNELCVPVQPRDVTISKPPDSFHYIHLHCVGHTEIYTQKSAWLFLQQFDVGCAR